MINFDTSQAFDYDLINKVIHSKIAEAEKNETTNKTALGIVNLVECIALGINTGLRFSDLSKITYDDIIKKDSIQGRAKKTNRPYIVFINEPCKAVFRRCIALRKVKGLPFSFSDEVVSFSNSYLNRKLKELNTYEGLGLDRVSSHSLRKTFGMNYMKVCKGSEEGLRNLSIYFNHSSVEMTRLYIGLKTEDIKEAILNFRLD